MSAAFCRVALPLTARRALSRRRDGSDVREETASSRLGAWGAALDSGQLEQALLIFLCFAAVISLATRASSMRFSFRYQTFVTVYAPDQRNGS